MWTELPQSQWLLITVNVVKKTVVVNCNCLVYFACICDFDFSFDSVVIKCYRKSALNWSRKGHVKVKRVGSSD